jgi:hypothetical protein
MKVSQVLGDFCFMVGMWATATMYLIGKKTGKRSAFSCVALDNVAPAELFERAQKRPRTTTGSKVFTGSRPPAAQGVFYPLIFMVTGERRM